MVELKTIEKRLKRRLIRLLGSLLKKGHKDFVPLEGRKLQKVLFLRPEKLGDMIISFPVFDGLKAHFPHIKIAVLASPKNEAVIKDDPRFDRIFLYKKSVIHDLKQLMRIRREQYDCVVDMICDDSVTALCLSQFTAPGKPRIGVGKARYRQYYDFNYDHRMGNTGHIIDNTLKLLTAFNIDPDTIDGYAPPHVEQRHFRSAESFLNSIGIDSPSPVRIGYNLSAGSPTRVWAAEKSVKLVNRLLNRYSDSYVILFTIPTERDRALEIQKRAGGRVHLIPDKLDLLSVSALISKLDLLISPDTSLIHIARSFHVPVVGLYSRFMRNFLLWQPYDQKDGAVVSDNEHNIFDITVDQVDEAVTKVLSGRMTGARG